jgi:hypothetical protein
MEGAGRQGGEMTPTMYAQMNEEKKKISQLGYLLFVLSLCFCKVCSHF